MLGVVVRCRFACYDRQWYRHHLYSAARAAEQQPDGRCQGHFASGWLGVGVRNHQCFGFSRPWYLGFCHPDARHCFNWDYDPIHGNGGQ